MVDDDVRELYLGVPNAYRLGAGLARTLAEAPPVRGFSQEALEWLSAEQGRALSGGDPEEPCAEMNGELIGPHQFGVYELIHHKDND